MAHFAEIFPDTPLMKNTFRSANNLSIDLHCSLVNFYQSHSV